jgi:hypothetical protein
MKKTYIAPELVVVKMNPVGVICTSSMQQGDPQIDGTAETRGDYIDLSRWSEEW